MCFDTPHSVVAGGTTRTESVKNGLALLSGCDLVGIHDGVRPLVSRELIINVLNEALRSGAAIPAVRVTDSLRKLSCDGSHTVDRGCFVAVQTPQFFRCDVITDVYAAIYGEFTDDASAVQAAGHRIAIVEGERSNIKVTLPEDMAVARALMECR